MIVCHDVWFRYKGATSWALRGVSLRVGRGETVAIMGQNGAGKSTFLRHLNGLLQPDRGDVYVDGVNTRTRSVAQLSKVVSVAFQNPEHQLFANTVEEELDFSLKTLDWSDDQKREAKRNAVKEFGLERFVERAPFSLSGGERKLVAIASLVVRDAPVIVLDEPTLGQDGKHKLQLASFLNSQAGVGKTIIVVTHDLEFASANFERLLVFHEGRLVADDEPSTVLTCHQALEKSALHPPQLTEVAAEVRKRHPEFPSKVVTVESFVAACCNLLGLREEAK
ncbi:MAG: ABC transporter ATP-binding protein [Promethearchaeota archaeon]